MAFFFIRPLYHSIFNYNKGGAHNKDELRQNTLKGPIIRSVMYRS